MTVVIYDTARGFFATRASFMLKAFGHPKVYVLDGGFAKWKKEGHAIESDVSESEFDQAYEYS